MPSAFEGGVEMAEGASRCSRWAQGITGTEGRPSWVVLRLVRTNVYSRRSRAETKLHSVKFLGQRLSARDFERQVAEVQDRFAVLNGFAAPGTPII